MEADEIHPSNLEAAAEYYDKLTVKRLSEHQKSHIIKDLRYMFIKRYGTKLSKDMKSYIPKRKSYNYEDLMEDLKFVLNHIHIQ